MGKFDREHRVDPDEDVVVTSWSQVVNLSTNLCRSLPTTQEEFDYWDLQDIDGSRLAVAGLAYMAENSFGGRWWEGKPTDVIPDGHGQSMYLGFEEESVELMGWESASSGATLEARKAKGILCGLWVVEFVAGKHPSAYHALLDDMRVQE